MLFCRCGCVTKPRSLCLAGLLATKLKSQVYSKVSEVTLGPFLVFFCYVLGTKLGAVLPLRMRHKAMQRVLCRLAGYKTEKSHFLSRVSEVTSGPFGSSFATIWARNWVLFCRCGCVTKLCSLCLAGSLETKVKSLNFIKVFNQSFNFISIL